MGAFRLGLSPLGETYLFTLIVCLVVGLVEYFRRRYIHWKRSQWG
jgi:hypothetical protein